MRGTRRKGLGRDLLELVLERFGVPFALRKLSASSCGPSAPCIEDIIAATFVVVILNSSAGLYAALPAEDAASNARRAVYYSTENFTAAAVTLVASPPRFRIADSTVSRVSLHAVMTILAC